jgi:hypothetical protein
LILSPSSIKQLEGLLIPTFNPLLSSSIDIDHLRITSTTNHTAKMGSEISDTSNLLPNLLPNPPMIYQPPAQPNIAHDEPKRKLLLDFPFDVIWFLRPIIIVLGIADVSLMLVSTYLGKDIIVFAVFTIIMLLWNMCLMIPKGHSFALEGIKLELPFCTCILCGSDPEHPRKAMSRWATPAIDMLFFILMLTAAVVILCGNRWNQDRIAIFVLSLIIRFVLIPLFLITVRLL